MNRHIKRHFNSKKDKVLHKTIRVDTKRERERERRETDEYTITTTTKEGRVGIYVHVYEKFCVCFFVGYVGFAFG
jgi:hypothetical protein